MLSKQNQLNKFLKKINLVFVNTLFEMGASVRQKNLILLFAIVILTILFFLITTPSIPKRVPRTTYILDKKIVAVLKNHSDALKKSLGEKVQLVGTQTAKLTELQIESGGNPKRNVIVTSWRSGSTFLGDILNSIDGTFYFYEPLMHYGVKRFNESASKEDKADIFNHIKKLLNCEFNNMAPYLNHAKEFPFQFEHNHRLWSDCNGTNPKYCFSPQFLEPYCSQFPFLTMKIVRTSLDIIQDLLSDESLNVRILLLVRDPRPTLHSRWKDNFCVPEKFPLCGKTELVCDQLISDFKTAVFLSQRYPNTFMTMRYEDLALSYYEQSGKILSFFGMAFNEDVKQFLDSHTQSSKGNEFSTFRDTKKIALRWTKQLSWERVSKIQIAEQCAEAMNLWGYKIANSEEELRSEEFNPLV